MHRTTITLVALGVILGGCVEPSGPEEPAGGAAQRGGAAVDLRVSELVATAGDPADPFGNVVDMLEVAPGVVAVADGRLGRLLSWDVEADAVALLARQGEGPGEVRQPVLLAARPMGGFALYDLGHRAFILYRQQLEHDRTITAVGLVSNPKDYAVLADGSHVLAGGRISDPRHLHRFSPEGERLGIWGDPPGTLEDTAARIQSAGGALWPLADGGFLFSFGAPLRIVRFPGPELTEPEVLVEDLDLRPELTDEEVLQPTRPNEWGFRWFFDRSTGAFVLDEGILNVVTRVYSGDSVWDLYDHGGQRLARAVVERAYTVHGMMGDGRILASYEDPATDERVAAVLGLQVR